MTFSIGHRFYHFFRWFVGFLFLWAAISKIANPTEFLASIYSYEIPLPKNVMMVMAITLPWIELLCALLLIANHWTESALLLFLLIMLVFTMATGQAWMRGLNITCGCFDLSLLGFGQKSQALKETWESVSVAFFRDLILFALLYYMLHVSMFKPVTSTSCSKPINSEL